MRDDLQPQQNFENRFYVNYSKRIAVFYFQAWGDNPMGGRFPIDGSSPWDWRVYLGRDGSDGRGELLTLPEYDLKLPDPYVKWANGATRDEYVTRQVSGAWSTDMVCIRWSLVAGMTFRSKIL